MLAANAALGRAAGVQRRVVEHKHREISRAYPLTFQRRDNRLFNEVVEPVNFDTAIRWYARCSTDRKQNRVGTSWSNTDGWK